MPGKSHGPRSLVGYNPWGRKESDTTERLLCVCVTVQIQFITENRIPENRGIAQFHFQRSEGVRGKAMNK